MKPPELDERRLVSFDETEIAYQASDGSGPPILFCNGLGGQRDAWSHQIAYFRDRYRVLSWDFRGLYGSGSAQNPEAVEIQDHAKDALSVLREEGVERTSVVAWSVGVQVALELFRAAPERVANLVLVNGVAGRPWDQFLNLNVMGQVIPLLLKGVGSVPAVLEGVVSQLSRMPESVRWAKRIGLAAKSADEELLSHITEGFRDVSMPRYIELLEAAGRHDAWDMLPRLDVPTLLVLGSRDWLTPRAAVERMARQIRGAELLMAPGAAHYVQLEFPDLLNLRIDKFFAERNYAPAQPASDG